MKSYEIKELEMPCSIATENEQKLAYELAQVMVENEELRQTVDGLIAIVRRCIFDAEKLCNAIEDIY